MKTYLPWDKDEQDGKVIAFPKKFKKAPPSTVKLQCGSCGNPTFEFWADGTMDCAKCRTPVRNAKVHGVF